MKRNATSKPATKITYIYLPYQAAYRTRFGYVVTFNRDLIERYDSAQSDLEAWEVGQLFGGN
jgi:hypothetical protein